jgi:hypothetical protein
LNENIIDKSDFEFAEGKKLIGIQIGFENSDYEQELRLTADLIRLLKEISGSENIKLIQPSKGSTSPTSYPKTFASTATTQFSSSWSHTRSYH